jgi:2,4-dienoyl-CoA reductase-like NADH-dependent reductase (Old Yellow Enzyme family)
MPQDLSALWEPLQVGPTLLKNRVTAAAMTLHYGEGGHLSSRHVAYYEARARGGIALQVSEEHGAHPSIKGGFVNAVTAWSDEAVPPFRALADATHAHDSFVFIQLFASGIQDNGALTLDWHPLMGPSRLPHPDIHEQPLPMGQAEIDWLVEAFGHSARNVAAADLRGIEIHGAHGWLIGQFFSPFFNDRTDRYGGSAENNCTLALEIGQRVRAVTGGKLTLGLKISMEEGLGAAGITPDYALKQLEVLAAAGIFDYFSISNGGAHQHGMQIPSMEIPDAYLQEFGRSCRTVVAGRAAVIVGHRIRDVETAARLVRGGAADLVAMTRSHLADPDIVHKARTGRAAETLRCAGENECIVRALKAWPVACLVNPRTGRELEWDSRLSRATDPRRVVVVGAGPAGLKAAATLAERGHAVSLLERSDHPGGHLRALSQLPNRSGWRDALDDLVRLVHRFGVDLRTSTNASADAIAGMQPDAVICATGAAWERTGIDSYRIDGSPIPGADGDNVLDLGTAAERVLSDPNSLGGSVLFFDLTGDYLPIGLADLLASRGVQVEIVTPRAVVGDLVLGSLDGVFILPRLAAAGVRFTPQHALEEIRHGSVQVAGIWGGNGTDREDVDTVVLSLLRAPRDAIANDLDAIGLPVVRIGDALTPRRTADAIYDGEKVGRALFADHLQAPLAARPGAV